MRSHLHKAKTTIFEKKCFLMVVVYVAAPVIFEEALPP